MPRHRHTLYLLLAILVALVVRLIVARLETEVGVDSVHYILMGDNIAHGRSWDTWNTTGGRWILPPLLPMLIALFRLMGASLEWSGHLAAVTAGTLLPVPIYFLTRRLYGETTALVAVILAGFTPILVDYSAVILTECLFAACALAMLIFAHRSFSEPGTAWDGFWAGVWAALALLTKTFGILLVPFLLLSYLFGKGGHSKVGPRKQVVMAAIGFLILAIPYWGALRQYTGRWVLDGKGIGQEARIYARDLTEEHIDPRYSGELTEDASDFAINAGPQESRPTEAIPGGIVYNYVKKYLQKLVRVYQDFPFTPAYPNNVLLLYLFPTLLLGLGLFTGRGSWRERPSDRFLLFWLCPFIFGLPLIFVEVRYFIPVIPLLIPFMALGAEKMGRWAQQRFARPEAASGGLSQSAALGIVVAVFILLALPKITFKLTNWDDPMVSYNPRKAAAEWLEANGYGGQRIMEYGHSVSFYSGGQSILIPQGDLSEVIRIARKYGADILSLDEFYCLRAHRRPELEFLFDTSQPSPPELERIYHDERHAGLHHVIYRIRSPEEHPENYARRF